MLVVQVGWGSSAQAARVSGGVWVVVPCPGAFARVAVPCQGEFACMVALCQGKLARLVAPCQGEFARVVAPCQVECARCLQCGCIAYMGIVVLSARLPSPKFTINT
jgi:hypothetical protein